MNASSNSGKYIIPFAVFIIFLNILLIAFLFLNQMGVFAQPETDISIDDIVLSSPVSEPVSFPE